MAIAGKVAPVPKGAWNTSTSYEKLNIVTHADCTFMARVNNVGQEPVAETTDSYWMFLVKDGDSSASSDFVGATASKAGKHGLVPAPAAGDEGKVLLGDGTWGEMDISSKLDKTAVVNNLTTTTAGYALDARQGKALNDDKLSKTGASSDNTVAFTSNDSATVFNSGNLAGQSAYPWTAVAQMASGEKHSSLFNKASTMFKNIRYIAKLIGTTDISEVGDGTLSGAISSINTNFNVLFPTSHEFIYTEIYSKTNNVLTKAQAMLDEGNFHRIKHVGVYSTNAYREGAPSSNIDYTIIQNMDVISVFAIQYGDASIIVNSKARMNSSWVGWRKFTGTALTV